MKKLCQREERFFVVKVVTGLQGQKRPAFVAVVATTDRKHRKRLHRCPRECRLVCSSYFCFASQITARAFFE